MDTARRPTPPLVYQPGEHPPAGRRRNSRRRPACRSTGNVRGPDTHGSRGDVAQGFAQAEIVVEGEYRTQTQTHCCMEPHAIVADWRDDGLTVWMSTQFTAGVRRELARAFDLKLSQVRVKVAAMGGGFGSKSQLGTYGRFAVMLSRQAGAPVRLVFDREEEQLDTGNRPATWQHLRIGARRDGTLTAISPAGIRHRRRRRWRRHRQLRRRRCTPARISRAQNDVFINAGRGSAMRGPGQHAGRLRAWSRRSTNLPTQLGLDPLALRDRIDPSPVRREERRLGAQRIGWDRRHKPGADTGRIRRGIGVAQSFWGANVYTNASCEVRLLRDGSVEVLSSVQDLGTGIGTILAQVVAEEFGLRPEDITVHIGDTDFPPGRRRTAAAPPPRSHRRRAPRRGSQADAVRARSHRRCTPRRTQLAARDGRIALRDDPARGLAFREAAALLAHRPAQRGGVGADDYGGFRRRMGDAALAQTDLGGVQFADVSVDTETGMIRVERVVAAQDCGRPINPKLIESQVQGGVLMGISYALLEQRIIDQHTGRVLNANLEQYKLVGPRETPADRGAACWKTTRARAPPTPMASPSRPTSPPRRRSRTPCSTRSACACASLPMTPSAVLAALGRLPVRS